MQGSFPSLDLYSKLDMGLYGVDVLVELTYVRMSDVAKAHQLSSVQHFQNLGGFEKVVEVTNAGEDIAVPWTHL